jgi:SH3-like domain-containing protein
MCFANEGFPSQQDALRQRRLTLKLRFGRFASTQGMTIRVSAGVVALALVLPGGALAAPAPPTEATPYFVSLKSGEVFMREGPSEQNRIKWVYHRKGLPMEVLASFEVWRRVRDMDGEIGWVHVALLSRERTAMVAQGTDVSVRSRDSGESDVVAAAKAGAIGQLIRCSAGACEVKFDGAEGWVERNRLWGVRDGQDY